MPALCELATKHLRNFIIDAKTYTPAKGLPPRCTHLRDSPLGNYLFTFERIMQRRMLTKEEEAASGGEDVQVRREDQEKINRFSSLHQKETNIEEELRAKLKEKEDLEEISNELELVDEEEKVPYKIGDCFVSLPQPEVLELLSKSQETIDEDVDGLKSRLESIHEEMGELKKALYGRFGRSINLET